MGEGNMLLPRGPNYLVCHSRLQGPLLLRWFNLNHIRDKLYYANNVWDKIIYPILNSNCGNVKVLEWTSNFTPHFITDVMIG